MNNVNTVTLTLKELVEKEMQNIFVDVMHQQVDRVLAEAKQKLYEFEQEERSKIKDEAQKLTLILLQKSNIDGLSVEFKI